MCRTGKQTPKPIQTPEEGAVVFYFFCLTVSLPSLRELNSSLLRLISVIFSIVYRFSQYMCFCLKETGCS